MIGRFFEVLEALTYEVSGLVAMAADINTISHAKIISMLMSSISKVLSAYNVYNVHVHTYIVYVSTMKFL